MKLPPIPDTTILRKNKQRRFFIVISVLIVVAGVICFLQAGWVSAMVRDISPGCVFRKWTGIACPGCGGTRAARALVTGDIIRAFQYNLLLPLAVLGLLLEYTRLGVVAFTSSTDWRSSKWYRCYFIIFAWLVPVWFIVRNLSGI